MVGMKIVEFVEKDIKLFDILIIEVFENVLIVDMVFGGLINIILYFFVIVNEVGIKLNFDIINVISDRILNFCKFLLVG